MRRIIAMKKFDRSIQRFSIQRFSIQRLSIHWLLFVMALAALPAVAADESLESFLERIRSPDDDTRMKARLEAPEWGSRAVAPLARLLDGRIARPETDDEETKAAASRRREAAITSRHALARIVHHAARPGADEERAAVAAELVKLVGPGRPGYVRREALNWLSLVGGDDHVEAVAKNLDDDGYQIAEAARLALERLPGKAAERALAEAIGRASDEKKPDLIFSLAKKRSVDSVPLFLELGRAEADEVRFSALQGLAHVGAPRGIEVFLAAVTRPEEPLRPRLYTELLRLADNLFARGETAGWRQLHAHALRHAPLEYQRERSLLHLAKRGDSRSVDTLLVGLDDASPRVRGSALRLLESLRGGTVSKALRRGYEEAKPHARPVILRALARHDPEGAKDLLEKAAGGADVELKIAALDVLGRLAEPSMEEAYLQAARGDGSSRPTALKGYLMLARAQLDGGGGSRALAMYSEAMKVAREPGERQQVLAGLVALKDPEAIDQLRPLLADAALANDAARSTIAYARQIADQGDVDRAEKYFREITAGKFPRDVIASAISELRRIDRDPHRAVLQRGFVLDWWLIGPIRDDDGKGMETKIFPEERIRFEVVETIGPRKYRWQRLDVLCLEGRVDLVPLFRRAERVIAYAYTEFDVPEDRELLFKMGSDDGIACWLNGERIHYLPASRSYQLDQDTVPVTLKKGNNKVLVKIGQGSGDWTFSFRTTDRDGRPVVLSRKPR